MCENRFKSTIHKAYIHSDFQLLFGTTLLILAIVLFGFIVNKAIDFLTLIVTFILFVLFIVILFLAATSKSNILHTPFVFILFIILFLVIYTHAIITLALSLDVPGRLSAHFLLPYDHVFIDSGPRGRLNVNL
ncbi:hypothetical protein RSAG8_13381, partial [Rhizoctonia solani AG-8 WAC10335]